MPATEHDPIATEAMRIAPLTSLSVEEVEHALRKLAEVLNESAGHMDAARPEHRHGRAAQASPFGPARKGGRR